MNVSSFIWSIADLLRGKYKPHEYGQVILLFQVLLRIHCVLEGTRAAVRKEAKRELAEIDADLKVVTGYILTMIAGLSA